MKKRNIIILFIVVNAIIGVLSSCSKQETEPVDYIQFKIESQDRFYAVYGVNENISSVYSYNDTLITGSFSVEEWDMLTVKAQGLYPTQTFMYYVIHNGTVIRSDSVEILTIFKYE